MRLFICEFITGGGLYDKALPDGLVREGDMMLVALLTDLLDAGVTDIVTTRDERLASIDLPIESIPVNDDFFPACKDCMQGTDAVLIIAPESEDVLYNLTLMAEQSDRYVLGCSSAAVKVAGSKLQTANLLMENDIPCIETFLLSSNSLPESESGWVIKPDDGVGGEHCYYCADKETMEKLKDSINTGNNIVQKYQPGTPASLSMICFQGKAQLLASNEQSFHFDHGEGILKKIVVNGLQEHWASFNQIAQKIAWAEKGLSGYVGVDLIVTDSGPVVVEINPRLTTSYAGLRQSLSLNPAELILSIWQNGLIAEIQEKEFHHVDLLLE